MYSPHGTPQLVAKNLSQIYSMQRQLSQTSFRAIMTKIKQTRWDPPKGAVLNVSLLNFVIHHLAIGPRTA